MSRSQFAILSGSSTKPHAPTTTSHEGGTVSVVSPETLLRRFLILGATGTFYANKRENVIELTTEIRNFIDSDPAAVLAIVRDVARNRLALRRDPTLFIHAQLTLPSIPLAVRREAYASLGEVAQTGYDILHWTAFRRAAGKSNQSFRKALGNWFLTRNDLSYQAVKYDQRDGWSLGDLLRLARPTPNSDGIGFMFQWITRPDDRPKATNHVNRLIQGYAAMRSANLAPRDVATIIRESRMPREAIPREYLAHREVWEALEESMPSQALLRNLGKLGSLGIVPDSLAARIRKNHPFAILLARATYLSGHGLKGKLSWTVDTRVSRSLDEAFEQSYGDLPVRDSLSVVVALDTSGSMQKPIAGTNITSWDAAAALASIMARQYPQAQFVAYSNGLTAFPKGLYTLDGFSREMVRLSHVGTYCWLPLDAVMRTTEHIDAVVSITDSETRSGVMRSGWNPFGGSAFLPAMVGSCSEYVDLIHDRKNPNFRHAVVATAANQVSIANHRDPLQLDLVGASADLPIALDKFLTGEA